MGIYIKVGGTEYPAIINGDKASESWDRRDVKEIWLPATAADAVQLLQNGEPWSVVQRSTADKLDSSGQPTGETTEIVSEWDNSDYSLCDGMIGIRRGMPLPEEALAAQLKEIEEAYDDGQ